MSEGRRRNRMNEGIEKWRKEGCTVGYSEHSSLKGELNRILNHVRPQLEQCEW